MDIDGFIREMSQNCRVCRLLEEHDKLWKNAEQIRQACWGWDGKYHSSELTSQMEDDADKKWNEMLTYIDETFYHDIIQGIIDLIRKKPEPKC